MAVVLHNNMAEHSEAGSNSYNGHGSMEYPEYATVGDKANWLQYALAPESPLWLQERALRALVGEFGSGSRIRHIAEAYGRESYSRAVYECFKRVHHYLDSYKRYIMLRSVLPREDYLVVRLRDDLERNSLKFSTMILCFRRNPSEIQGLKERYHSISGVQLEADIQRFTDGYHRELLLARIGIQTPAARHGDSDVEMFDLDRVTRISGSLHQAFEQITYRSPQKNIMNNILGQDREYLSAVMCSYPAYYGRSLEMAEHSEAGSNSYNRHGSAEYPLHATVEDKAKWLRNALAPESPLWLQERALSGRRIDSFAGLHVSRSHRIAEAYSWESYSRGVYKRFK